MIELRNKIMLDYLKRGTAMAFSLENPPEDGAVASLVRAEIVDGKTYQVDFVHDTRQAQYPYVIVMMKETTDIWANWTHYVSKLIFL